MIVKGILEPLVADVSFKFLEGTLGAKIAEKEWDLLVVNGNSTIRQDRFNLNPGDKLDKVANEISINLSLLG